MRSESVGAGDCDRRVLVGVQNGISRRAQIRRGRRLQIKMCIMYKRTGMHSSYGWVEAVDGGVVDEDGGRWVRRMDCEGWKGTRDAGVLMGWANH